MVQDIERIDGNSNSWRNFIARFGTFKVAEPAQIVFRVSRPFEGVSTDSGGTHIGHSRVIVIAAGRQRVRTAGIQEHADPQTEQLHRMNRAQEIEAMALVEIGAAPLSGQSVVVSPGTN